MKRNKFISELKEFIGKTAYKRDPNTTAYAIYFMSKQYPVIVSNQRTYMQSLKVVKTHLSEKFGWRMVEIHKCFCILKKLTKYIKNST